MANIDDRLRGLERTNVGLKAELRRVSERTGDEVSRLAVGGSGGYITTVKTLPAIPIRPRLVFWTSADGGTGDNGLWFAAPGYTVWSPDNRFTTQAGTPAE